ncbi:hypothetical protein GCM10028777_31390 [Angustibacter speluncae]
MDNLLLLTLVTVPLASIAAIVVGAIRPHRRWAMLLTGVAGLVYTAYLLLWPGEEILVFPLAALFPVGAIVQSFKRPALRTA